MPNPHRETPHPGDVVAVAHVPGAYRLPDGLREGDRVTLVTFDHGYWECERDGGRFTIYMANIEGLGRARS